MANKIVRISGQNFYADELYHHGVLGMKWGKHIFGKGRSSSGKAGSKTNSKTVAKPANKNIKKANSMTDDELDAAISRMRKIQTYNELSKSLQPKIETGKKFSETNFGKATTDILIDSYKNIGKQVVTYGLGKLANAAISAAGGESDAVNPKKGQKDK